MILGFIIDVILGDPSGWPHIVIGFGKIVKLYEKWLYSAKNKRIAGFFLVVFTIITCVIPVLLLFYIASFFGKWFVVLTSGIICWQCLALKSLKDETRKVFDAINTGDIERARYAVSMVVGRDTESLDSEGVIKACVETIAENTSDGIGAPLLYMGILGPIASYVYKIINTMDSMIGYKNDKYIKFGYFAAKLDDIANYIPARVTAIFMILASCVLRYDYKNAYRIFKRDRYKHASPNSAQTEAVMAGALNIRLAGDAYYFGKLYKKEYIGDPNREICAEDILKAHKLMNTTAYLMLGFLVVISVVERFINGFI